MYNTIDYIGYNDYPITGPGYIPDNSYTLHNFEQLYKEELDSHKEITEKVNQKQDFATHISILFACKSDNHKFSQGYLQFLTFCLSLLVNPDFDFENLLDY